MASPFLTKLNQVVESHLSDVDFGISELCAALSISRAHLHRKIKKETGYPTSHYVRTYRLQKAKELLSTSSLRVSEVANAVGFKNLSYFSTCYLETFGFSPKDTKNHT